VIDARVGKEDTTRSGRRGIVTKSTCIYFSTRATGILEDPMEGDPETIP
jgi:hypothetical protein